MAEPQPGDLDRHRASAAVAGFADALFAHAVAAVVGRSSQPDIAADLAAVVEVAIEHFMDQSLPADGADTFEHRQLHDLGLRRAGHCRAPFGFALRFEQRQCLFTRLSRSCSYTISSLSP